MNMNAMIQMMMGEMLDGWKLLNCSFAPPPAAAASAAAGQKLISICCSSVAMSAGNRNNSVTLDIQQLSTFHNKDKKPSAPSAPAAVAAAAAPAPPPRKHGQDLTNLNNFNNISSAKSVKQVTHHSRIHSFASSYKDSDANSFQTTLATKVLTKAEQFLLQQLFDQWQLCVQSESFDAAVQILLHIILLLPTDSFLYELLSSCYRQNHQPLLAVNAILMVNKLLTTTTYSNNNNNNILPAQPKIDVNKLFSYSLHELLPLVSSEYERQLCWLQLNQLEQVKKSVIQLEKYQNIHGVTESWLKLADYYEKIGFNNLASEAIHQAMAGSCEDLINYKELQVKQLTFLRKMSKISEAMELASVLIKEHLPTPIIHIISVEISLINFITGNYDAALAQLLTTVFEAHAGGQEVTHTSAFSAHFPAFSANKSLNYMILASSYMLRGFVYLYNSNNSIEKAIAQFQHAFYYSNLLLSDHFNSNSNQFSYYFEENQLLFSLNLPVNNLKQWFLLQNKEGYQFDAQIYCRNNILLCIDVYNELLLRYGLDCRIIWYRANLYKAINCLEQYVEDLIAIEKLNPAFISQYYSNINSFDFFDSSNFTTLQPKLFSLIHNINNLLLNHAENNNSGHANHLNNNNNQAFSGSALAKSNLQRYLCVFTGYYELFHVDSNSSNQLTASEDINHYRVCLADLYRQQSKYIESEKLIKLALKGYNSNNSSNKQVYNVANNYKDITSPIWLAEFNQILLFLQRLDDESIQKTCLRLLGEISQLKLKKNRRKNSVVDEEKLTHADKAEEDNIVISINLNINESKLHSDNSKEDSKEASSPRLTGEELLSKVVKFTHHLMSSRPSSTVPNNANPKATTFLDSPFEYYNCYLLRNCSVVLSYLAYSYLLQGNIPLCFSLLNRAISIEKTCPEIYYVYFIYSLKFQPTQNTLLQLSALKLYNPLFVVGLELHDNATIRFPLQFVHNDTNNTNEGSNPSQIVAKNHFNFRSKPVPNIEYINYSILKNISEYSALFKAIHIDSKINSTIVNHIKLNNNNTNLQNNAEENEICTFTGRILTKPYYYSSNPEYNQFLQINNNISNVLSSNNNYVADPKQAKVLQNSINLLNDYTLIHVNYFHPLHPYNPLYKHHNPVEHSEIITEDEPDFSRIHSISSISTSHTHQTHSSRIIFIENRGYNCGKDNSSWKVEQWLKESHKALIAHDVNGLIYCYNRILALQSNYSPSLNYLLGLIVGNSGKVNLSNTISKLFGGDKIIPIAWDIYLRGNNSEEALKNSDMALLDYSYICFESGVELGDVYWRRGLLYKQRNNNKLALADINKAISITLNDQAVIISGASQIVSQGGSNISTLNSLKAKLEVFHLIAGQLEYVEENYNQAITHTTEVLLINNKNVAAFKLRGLAYLAKNNNYQLAVRDFEVYLQHKPLDCLIQFKLAHCCSLLGETDRALSVLDQLLQYNPNNSNLLYSKAIVLMRSNNYKTAQLTLLNLLSYNSRYKLAYLRLAECLEARKKFDEAIETLHSLLNAFNIAEPSVHRLIARNHIQLAQLSYSFAVEDHNKARQEEEEKLERQRKNSASPLLPLSSRVSALESTANHSTALPTNMADILALVVQKQREGKIRSLEYVRLRLSLALSFLQLAIEINNKDFEAYYLLGLVNLFIIGNRSKDEQRAQKFIEKSIELNPEYYPSRFLYGLLLYRNNFIELATVQFKFVLKHNPNHYLALSTLGYIYYDAGELQQSRYYYNKILHNFSNNINAEGIYSKADRAIAYANRGLTKLQTHDVTNALADFEACLHLLPEFSLALLHRAQCYKVLGQFDLAIKDIKNCLPKLKLSVEETEREKRLDSHLLNPANSSTKTPNKGSSTGLTVNSANLAVPSPSLPVMPSLTTQKMRSKWARIKAELILKKKNQAQLNELAGEIEQETDIQENSGRVNNNNSLNVPSLNPLHSRKLSTATTANLRRLNHEILPRIRDINYFNLQATNVAYSYLSRTGLNQADIDSIQNSLGILLHQQHKLNHPNEKNSKGQEEYESLALFSNNSSAFQSHYNRGLIYFEKGEMALALGEFKSSVALNSAANNAAGYNNLAVCYELLGQLDQAIANYSEAIRLQPLLIIAQFNLANCKLSLANYNEAVTLYNQFLKRNQQIQLIRSKEKRRNKLENIEEMKEGKRKNVANGQDVAAGSVFDFDSKDPFEQLLANQATQTNSISRKAGEALGNIQSTAFSMASRDSDAKIFLCNSSDNDSSSENIELICYALNNRAICYQNLGQYELALLGYSKSLELCPSLSFIRFNRAHLYMLLGRCSDSLLDLKRIQSVSSDYNAIKNKNHFELLLDYCKKYQWALAVASRDIINAINHLPIANTLNLTSPVNNRDLFNPNMLVDPNSSDWKKLQGLINNGKNANHADLTPLQLHKQLTTIDASDSHFIQLIRSALNSQLHNDLAACFNSLIQASYLLPSMHKNNRKAANISENEFIWQEILVLWQCRLLTTEGQLRKAILLLEFALFPYLNAKNINKLRTKRRKQVSATDFPFDNELISSEPIKASPKNASPPKENSIANSSADRYSIRASRLLNYLASLYLIAQQYSNASLALDLACEEDGSNIFPLFNRALTHTKQGRFNQTINDFIAILKLYNDNNNNAYQFNPAQQELLQLLNEYTGILGLNPREHWHKITSIQGKLAMAMDSVQQYNKAQKIKRILNQNNENSPNQNNENSPNEAAVYLENPQSAAIQLAQSKLDSIASEYLSQLINSNKEKSAEATSLSNNFQSALEDFKPFLDENSNNFNDDEESLNSSDLD
jgi:tetratricopeptide (TPR) repeat protein